MYSLYYHLSSRTVKQGEVVYAGEQIGVSGNTGSAGTGVSYGYHLHFQVQFSSSNNTNIINPLPIYHWDDSRSTIDGFNSNPLYISSGSKYIYNLSFRWEYIAGDENSTDATKWRR